MSVMSLQRTSCVRFAANRTLSVPRLALNSRRASVQVVAFRDDKVSSKISKTANKLGNKAKQATKQGTSSNRNKGQRAILGAKAPTTKKEEGESIVTFVAVASLFLTGVLFVVPALFAGSPVTSEPLQSGMNKSVGIKEPGNASGPGYAPGPSAAAAPGTAATR